MKQQGPCKSKRLIVCLGYLFSPFCLLHSRFAVHYSYPDLYVLFMSSARETFCCNMRSWYTLRSAQNYGVILKVSLSVLTAVFPGEPGLADFIVAKDNGSSGDNWSYKRCKAPVKSSPPTNQHPTSYRPDALPVAQPTASKHWREIDSVSSLDFLS